MSDYKYPENTGYDEEKNEFEKDMRDLADWQQNQYNPGRYIGTGRVARPLRKLKLSGGLSVFIGTLFLLPALIPFVMNGDRNVFDIVSEMTSLIVPVILGIAFIYGGIKKIKDSYRKR